MRNRMGTAIVVIVLVMILMAFICFHLTRRVNSISDIFDINQENIESIIVLSSETSTKTIIKSVNDIEKIVDLLDACQIYSKSLDPNQKFDTGYKYKLIFHKKDLSKISMTIVDPIISINQDHYEVKKGEIAIEVIDKIIE